MWKDFRFFLWGLAMDLQNALDPHEVDPEDEYYVRVKNDDTGEEYMVLDWIQVHNEKINALEEKMIWVISELNRLKQEKKIMYEELNCFEEALKHFGTRVEVICAMELGGRIGAEDAYQMIKEEMKEVKKCRKQFKKDEC